jgi:hypothetical protein
MIDFESLNRAACVKGQSVIQRLLPGGKFRGAEYTVRNPLRNDHRPGSFSINCRTGHWADFATGDKGGDLISLVAYLKGFTQGEAARVIADMLGFPLPRTNGLANGANRSEVLPTRVPLTVAPPSTARDIGAEDASPFPARTPPDASGKPRFVIAGDEGPPVTSNELRRHLYRRDKIPVRVKVKYRDQKTRKPSWANWYRVIDEKGVLGWQSGKPDGYLDVPYVTFGSNPFDRDVLDDVLYWPEGEKDVDSVTRLGGLAFTFGGAGDGLPASPPDDLAHRDVVILADNDQGGRKHAQDKAALIHAVAKSVKIVEFLELPPKGDVSDWSALGHDEEELKALVDAAPVLGPRDDADRRRVAPKRILVSQSLSTVVPERIEWLWPGRIAVGKLTLFGGKPGVGKSQLTSCLAATVSKGAEWPCGEGRSPQGAVVMLSAEDGIADTIVPRLIAAGADL